MPSAANPHPGRLQRVMTLVACLLILRVTAGVLLNYRDYFPPNFESEFLRGRERYFFGDYRWAFYSHLVSGPVSLILGTILVSDGFRLRFRWWHRYLGRIQVGCVLFLVAPSGLWMAYYVDTGIIAAAGFAALAIATGTCVAIGWRSAVNRRFLEHRRWMWRCFLLLCSAVVLRLIAGLATAVRFEAVWFNPLLAWTSWLIPLLVFEGIELGHRQRFPIRPTQTP